MAMRTILLLSVGIAALVTVVALVGCADTASQLPTPEQLAEHGAVPTEADISALRRGRALLVTECARCHRLYWPKEYPPEQWKGLVRKYGRLASLSARQTEDLELYLRVASAAAH